MKSDNTSVILLIIAIILAGACSTLLIKSLNWPYILDVPFLHYIAWQITEGAVPYRDFFDMNLPGTYMIHIAILKILGSSDLAFRIFDITCLLLIAVFTILFCKKLSLLNAVLAALLFAAFHLFNGNLYSGQRDFISLFFIISSLYFFIRYREAHTAFLHIALAGFLIGYAISIKPFALFWVGIMVATIMTDCTRTLKLRNSNSFLLMCCAILPNAALILWVAAIGGLKDFLEIYFTYAPIYAKLHLADRFSILHKPFLGIPLLWLSLTIVVLALLRLRELKKIDIRHVFSLLGIAYGLLNFFIQGKGLYYHLYPYFFFMFLSATLLLAPCDRKRMFFQKILLIAVLYMAIGLAYYSIRNIIVQPWQFITEPHYVRQLEADLSGKIAPPETIQFLEPDAAGTIIMIKKKIKQPTRILGDAYLFIKTEHPFIQDLRSEFMNDLIDSPPVFLVISKQGWPITGYERIETFPALSAWISTNYVLDLEKPWYRIYKRKQ